jgi:chromosomal replication initiator protein
MSDAPIIVEDPVSTVRRPRSLEESWKRCGSRLRAELGEDVFSSWFGRLELEAVANRHARFTVPTRFLKSWIESHYIDRILATLNGEIGEIAGLTLAVRSSTQSPLAAPPAAVRRAAPGEAALAEYGVASRHEAAGARAPARRDEGAAAPDSLPGSPLDRRLSFSTFLVGRSNQLAYSAAQRVTETRSGQLPAFSPLYIHAAVGLGKTHLLQAIAHAATAQGRRAIYLTAEKFMYGFVAALKAQTAIAFKESLRSIDLLIFDDAQFLQGKSIQTEFCHALNALVDAGRQVVVAADRPPGDLEALEERVRSRLAGGLCVEMGGLDEPLRIKILEARIAVAQQTQSNFEVSPAVLAFVARSINSNGRDLDGAVNRLLAHTTLTGAPLSVETAEIAIRDLVRPHEPKRVKIEDIQKLVASHYSVTRADILSSRRTATVVKPRQIAMYLAKTLTLRSLPEIGRRFGGRDHTTVLHAVRKIEGLSHADRALNDELELLKHMLQD